MKWLWKDSRRDTGNARDATEPDSKPTPTAPSPRRMVKQDDIAQLSMRGDARIIQRFKQLCEAQGRRTYMEMLVILMDHYERPDCR